MNSRIISHIASLIAYMAFQLLLFKDNALWGVAVCFIYVGFLILLPLTLSPIIMMTIGFFTGLFIDTFYNTTGIHTFACVFITFIRPHYIKLITPKGGYEGIDDITVREFGMPWFLLYSGSIILIHHLIIFFLEDWGTNIGSAMTHTFTSSVFTLFVLVLFQYLTKRPAR